MRHLFIISLLCFFVFDTMAWPYAFPIEFEWFHQYSANNAKNRTILLKANHGYLYNVSVFNDSTFEMDDFHFNNIGGQDMLLSKLDTFGNIIWVKNLSTAAKDTAIDMDFDMIGNPVILFPGKLKKLNKNDGDEIWSTNHSGYSLCLDYADNIYLAGLNGIYKLNSVGNIVSNLISTNGVPESIAYSPYDSTIIFGGNVNNGFTIGNIILYYNPNQYSYYGWIFVSKFDLQLNNIWIRSEPIKNATCYSVKSNPKSGDVYMFTGNAGSGATYSVSSSKFLFDGTPNLYTYYGYYDKGNGKDFPIFYVDSNYLLIDCDFFEDGSGLKVIDLNNQKEPVFYAYPSNLPNSVTTFNKSIYIGGISANILSLGKVIYKYPALYTYHWLTIPLIANLCQRDTLEVYSNVLTALGVDTPHTITWNPAPDTTIGNMMYLYIDTSMQYKLTVSNANGDTSYYYLNINLADTTIKPKIYASDTVLCDTIMLVSSLPFRSYTNDRWLFNGKRLINKHNDTILVTKPGVYTFVKDNFCYPESSDSIVISSKIDFNITQTPTDSVCHGNPISISGIPNAYSYFWPSNIQSGVPFIANYDNNSFLVTATDSNGCKRTKEFKLKIRNNSTLNITVTDSIICIGDSVILFAQGADSISWNNGISNNQPFFPIQTSTYTVIGIDTNNCKSIDSISIYVRPLPIMNLAVSDSIICIGDSVILFAQGADSISWNNGISNNQPFFPITSALFTATGTNTNFCKSNKSVFIEVNPSPLIPVLEYDYKNHTLNLLNNHSSEIKWYYNNFELEDTNSNSLFTKGDGIYFVKATDSNSCFSVSEKVLISDNYRDLIILPNPFHDKISINAAFTNDEVLTFQLFNVNGSIILDDKKQNAIKTGIHSFQINNLDKLSNGIYFLHLIVSEQSYLIKLQKE
jgi:hypothetical protein